MALIAKEVIRVDEEGLPKSDAKIVLKNINRIYHIPLRPFSRREVRQE
ncbi:MAG: hypothetical protein ABSC17_03465 [Thermacetogeniaceae bacterium]